jgi:predicted GH43/DUF377 family glycosyl hydrolase
MIDIAKRFPSNPILLPKDIAPSDGSLQVICLLNPGVFRFDGKIWLLVRVAESRAQKEGFVCFPVISELGKLEVLEVDVNDPELISTDARVMNYRGLDYLTTVSHLRLLSSEDGIRFTQNDEYPPLFGMGELERFGIEDCRVSKIHGVFYLTYTAVSASGVGVGLRTTTDWKNFSLPKMVLPPHNKDCAIFEGKIDGKFFALHRPSSKEIGGNFIWLCDSIDGERWGNHKCIIRTRGGMWDSGRVGAGAAPIWTESGWLAIYHGADEKNRYCLGAFLLDLQNPAVVLGRTVDPIMVPIETYELSGFFGEVVFTNGHIVEGDKLTIYYGAADEFVCGAVLSIAKILEQTISVK